MPCGRRPVRGPAARAIDRPDRSSVGRRAGRRADRRGRDLDLALAADGRRVPATAEPDADLDLDFVDDEPAPAPTAGLPLIEADAGLRPTAHRGRWSSRTGSSTTRRTPTCTASWRTGCSSRATGAGRRGAAAVARGLRARRGLGRRVGDRRSAGGAGAGRDPCTTRSGSSWRSGPASGPRCSRRIWRWATRSAGPEPPTRRWPCTVGSTSTIPTTRAPRPRSRR